MREEMNHLIEYYSVLRKSLEMVFDGADDAQDANQMSVRQALEGVGESISGVSLDDLGKGATESMEAGLLLANDASGSDDNSDNEVNDCK